MKLSHVRTVFVKDGREILRDRRTLFVNLVLPVLLYPLLALFSAQIIGLAKTAPEDRPAILLNQLPEDVQKAFNEAAKEKTAPFQLITLSEEENNTFEKLLSEHNLALNKKDIIKANAQTPELEKLGEKNEDKPRAETESEIKQVLDEEKTSEVEDVTKSSTETRAALLNFARKHNLSIIISATNADNKNAALTLRLIADNAQSGYDIALNSSRKILKKVADKRLQDRLSEHGLSSDFIITLDQETESLASIGEEARTKIAAIIPIFLVMMAISGAFYPALDLIAGERERGTLETLLAWPADREALFIGKLLVVICGAMVTIILNLLSLGVTAGIMSAQVPDIASKLSDGISIGLGAFAISILLLIPIVVALSAASLALAGLANSYKEAQNYLTPLILAVTLPSMVCLMPGVTPNAILDIIPIIGPLVVLRESLQANSLPFLHIILSTSASIVFATILLRWSVRLFNNENFLYPRAGASIFAITKKSHSEDGPRSANALDAIMIFAICTGVFILSSGFFVNFSTPAMVAGPLIFGILLPVLFMCKFMNLDPLQSLGLRRAGLRNILISIPLGFMLIYVSLLIGGITAPFLPTEGLAEQEEMMTQIFEDLALYGGFSIMFLCIAVTPGICEEFLCRGVLLKGLRNSLGTQSGVLLSAALFAALHMSPHRFFPQFILGILLAIAALKTRSIWVPVILHTGHNGGVLILQEIANTVLTQEQQDHLAGLGAEGDLSNDELMNLLQSPEYAAAMTALMVFIGIGVLSVILIPLSLRALRAPEVASEAESPSSS